MPVSPSELPFAFGVGFPELIVIAVIFVLLFGASRLPKIARGIGQSVVEFKKGIKEGEEDPDKKKIDDKS